MTDIKNWMVKKRLKLNIDKTKCMLFGTENALKNYEQFQHIMIGASNIKIVPVVRNLGVYIDSNLTMKNLISNTVKVCNHHLRNITFIRKYLNVYGFSLNPSKILKDTILLSAWLMNLNDYNSYCRLLVTISVHEN